MDREHNLVGFASLRVLCGEKLFFSSGGSGHEDLHAALKTQLLVLHDFTDQKLFFCSILVSFHHLSMGRTAAQPIKDSSGLFLNSPWSVLHVKFFLRDMNMVWGEPPPRQNGFGINQPHLRSSKDQDAICDFP